MLRRLFPSLITLALLACSDGTSPQRDILGTWSLETVSGQPLPFVLEQDGARKVELTGETVTLLATGRQTMVTSFRVTDGGGVFVESIPAPGNYTIDGATLLLTFDNDEDTYTAMINGEIMTIDDIGLRFVYRHD
jgi:hypothetical protein